jgi:cation transport ATPase
MNDAKNTSTILKIDGMHCASCQKPIEKALRETAGVTDVSVNLANREVSVESAITNDALIAAVASAGFEAVVDQVQSLENDDRANKEKFHDLIRKTILALGVGALLMLFGMYAPPIGTEWNLIHGAWLLVAAITSGVM